MYGPILKLVNDQAERDYLEVDFLQDPFHGPQVFNIPLASKRQVLGGDNIFRDGADIVATKRENAGLQIQTGFQECDWEKALELKEKIERLCEQARLRSERGWGPKVELQWRPEGKYFTRYADILDGDLDMPLNWLQMESPQHTIKPEDCILTLIRKPYWRESEETLENWVENPSFLLTQGGYVYEPAFGFDCWNSVGGATGGVDTINWIQGGQSAYIVCPAGGGIDVGIESDDISLDASTWYYVECWIWHRGGNRITLRIERQTGPAWLTPVAQWTVGESPVIDEQGKHIDSAWRAPGFIRKGFVFQAPATDSYRINIGVTAADDIGGSTEFDVDRVYLTEAANLNWTVEGDRVLDPTDDWKEIYLMPRAWCSGRLIRSHTDEGDCEHTSGDIENHIRWIDVEDVPGNLESSCKLLFQYFAIGLPGLNKFWVSKRTRINPFNFRDELNPADVDVMGIDTASDLSQLVPDCTYLHTDFITDATMRTRAAWHLSSTQRKSSEGMIRILGILRQNGGTLGDILVRIRLRWGLASVYGTTPYDFVGESCEIVPLAAGAWQIIDFGLFPIPWQRAPSEDISLLTIIYQAQRVAGSATLDLAALFLMPTTEAYLITDTMEASSFSSWEYWLSILNEISNVILYDSSGQIIGRMESLGPTFSLSPKKQNRFFFIEGADASDGGNDYTHWNINCSPFRIQFQYAPRFL